MQRLLWFSFTTFFCVCSTKLDYLRPLADISLLMHLELFDEISLISCCKHYRSHYHNCSAKNETYRRSYSMIYGNLVGQISSKLSFILIIIKATLLIKLIIDLVSLVFVLALLKYWRLQLINRRCLLIVFFILHWNILLVWIILACKIRMRVVAVLSQDYLLFVLNCQPRFSIKRKWPYLAVVSVGVLHY